MRTTKDWARAAQATTKPIQLEAVVTAIRIEMRDAIARAMSRRGFFLEAEAIRELDPNTATRPGSRTLEGVPAGLGRMEGKRLAR